MNAGGSLPDRFKRLVSAERLSIMVGLAVMIAAVIIGVIMGGGMLLGILGVVIAVAGFLLMGWRNRQGRVVGSSIGAVVAHFAAVTVAILVIIQLVPYGRSHTNPPVIGEPDWSSAQTRELMVNACFGCHSNEVEWPWYSNVAPISWVVTQHVDEGRDEVNYSEFTVDSGDADETIEVIRDGSMPPSYYTVFGLHPEAKLTDAEIEALVAGLRLTPGMTEDGSEYDD